MNSGLWLGLFCKSSLNKLYFQDQALPVDDLRDLLLASMQNTISLTELATQQTSKISTITLALNEAKSQIEHLQGDLLTSKTKINELTGRLEAQNEAFTESKTALEELKNAQSTTQSKIQSLTEGQSEVKAGIAALPTWPEGSYCILASGDCPPGFTRYSGHIRAFDTYGYNSGYIKAAVFGDSYMGCHGPCGRHTSWDAEFGITSCCK